MILCLLATCKVFTQTDTLKTKYVFLTENQAKSNIKELIFCDGLKLISTEQENRITNLQEQNFTYWRIINTKDSIIGEKDGIIELKDKIINAKKPIEFHTYAGTSIFNLDFNSLSLYGRASIEFKKFNVGAQVNYLINDFYNLPNLYYKINVEYKIF